MRACITKLTGKPCNRTSLYSQFLLYLSAYMHDLHSEQPVIPYGPNKRILKGRGIHTFAWPEPSGLRIAPFPRQATQKAHADIFHNVLQPMKRSQNMYEHTSWTSRCHCSLGMVIKVAKFDGPQYSARKRPPFLPRLPSMGFLRGRCYKYTVFIPSIQKQQYFSRQYHQTLYKSIWELY